MCTRFAIDSIPPLLVARGRTRRTCHACVQTNEQLCGSGIVAFVVQYFPAPRSSHAF